MQITRLALDSSSAARRSWLGEMSFAVCSRADTLSLSRTLHIMSKSLRPSSSTAARISLSWVMLRGPMEPLASSSLKALYPLRPSRLQKREMVASATSHSSASSEMDIYCALIRFAST